MFKFFAKYDCIDYKYTIDESVLFSAVHFKTSHYSDVLFPNKKEPNISKSQKYIGIITLLTSSIDLVTSYLGHYDIFLGIAGIIQIIVSILILSIHKKNFSFSFL